MHLLFQNQSFLDDENFFEHRHDRDAILCSNFWHCRHGFIHGHARNLDVARRERFPNHLLGGFHDCVNLDSAGLNLPLVNACALFYQRDDLLISRHVFSPGLVSFALRTCLALPPLPWHPPDHRSIGRRPSGVYLSTASGRSLASRDSNSSRDSPVCSTSVANTSGPIACSSWCGATA